MNNRPSSIVCSNSELLVSSQRSQQPVNHTPQLAINRQHMSTGHVASGASVCSLQCPPRLQLSNRSPSGHQAVTEEFHIHPSGTKCPEPLISSTSLSSGHCNWSTVSCRSQLCFVIALYHYNPAILPINLQLRPAAVSDVFPMFCWLFEGDFCRLWFPRWVCRGAIDESMGES